MCRGSGRLRRSSRPYQPSGELECVAGCANGDSPKAKIALSSFGPPTPNRCDHAKEVAYSSDRDQVSSTGWEILAGTRIYYGRVRHFRGTPCREKFSCVLSFLRAGSLRAYAADFEITNSRCPVEKGTQSFAVLACGSNTELLVERV